MENVHVNSGILAFTCGLLSAKWAMELGSSQLRQVLWGLGGVLFGPLVLLLLYVRLVGSRQKMLQPGGQWIACGPAAQAIQERKEILSIEHRV